MKRYRGIDVGSTVWVNDDGEHWQGTVLSIHGTGADEWDHEHGEFRPDVSVYVRFINWHGHYCSGLFRPCPNNHNVKENWVLR